MVHVLDDWLPYIVIAVVTLVLIAATVFLSRMAWRRQLRRYIVGLLGRREAIGAALRSADAALRELASGSVSAMLAFAAPEAEERRTFSEIASRMRIEAQEIAALPLPKNLWPLADTLGKAADALGEQVGRVGDSEGEQALDALIALDLTPVHRLLAEANGYIESLSAVYDLSDPAVYGGGLYI